MAKTPNYPPSARGAQRDPIAFLKSCYNRKMRALVLILFAVTVVSMPQFGRLAAAEAQTLQPDEAAAGSFLVAQRSLVDPNFAGSVVYLVAHGQGGSLGLIVNRISDVSLDEAAPEFPERRADYALYYGGPVGLPMILMLGRGEAAVDAMLPVADGVYISSEQPVMQAALSGAAREGDLRFYVGYAGWSTGQLQSELERGSWHLLRADPDAVFAADTRPLWEDLIDRLEPIGIQVKNGPARSTQRGVDFGGRAQPRIESAVAAGVIADGGRFTGEK